MEDRRPTLVYCRESRDENSLHYQRIETQRDILLDFCRRRGLTNIVEVVLDDDCTGTDFRRFDQVVRRVKAGQVRVLVFKDASRLGRNLKESLIFRDLMAEYGAELLFESEEYSEDFFPLKAWFNEQRAKEDGEKIRRVLRHKMESGTLLVKPAYGYRRCEEGMAPREDTAEVVRWLFSQAAAGRGTGELAAALNAAAVPTPSRAAGLAGAAERWNAQHVRRILSDPVYTGTRIHHKSSKASYKSKKTVRHDPAEWIVLEDQHPPLVERAVFEQVQALRRRYRPREASAGERPFSGLLFCGCCGSPLVLRRKKGRPGAYICGKNHREGTLREGRGCTPHRVREEELYALTERYIRDLLARVDLSALRPGLPDREKTGALEQRLREVRREMDMAYDDRLRGVIPEGLFVRRCAALTEREERLLDQLRQCREKIQKMPPEHRLTEVPPGDIIKYLDVRKLGKEQLRLLFSSITVYAPGEGEWPALRETGGLLVRTRAAP